MTAVPLRLIQGGGVSAGLAALAPMRPRRNAVSHSQRHQCGRQTALDPARVQSLNLLMTGGPFAGLFGTPESVFRYAPLWIGKVIKLPSRR